MARITALAENNNEDHEYLKEEFGFSTYIENGKDKIIFDTGKAGEFLNNAKKLSIDISEANAMVLSHAHYDHCGGVMKYFDTFGPEGKTFYIKNSFFDNSDKKYYHDTVGQKFDFTDGTPGYFYIGIDFTQKDIEDRNVMTEYLDTDSMRIGNNVTLHGNFTPSNDIKMVVKKNEQYEIDAFEEEVALAIDTNAGLVIISGCSHNGILTIVNTIQERMGKQVYAVIGGFHLLDASEEKIQTTIERFKELNVEKIGLSHCTGPKATQMFLEQMPSETFVFETGSVFEVDQEYKGLQKNIEKTVPNQAISGAKRISLQNGRGIWWFGRSTSTIHWDVLLDSTILGCTIPVLKRETIAATV